MSCKVRSERRERGKRCISVALLILLNNDFFVALMVEEKEVRKDW